ncbi:hypothetical protein ACQU0X_08060 [Pseudovibrio ascidiaceicola]|uniref:hypothetical protein n=1 Tax=Pseudovibrio ascidiaceicola TaxID=285279 RepID=UPI003D367246
MTPLRFRARNTAIVLQNVFTALMFVVFSQFRGFADLSPLLEEVLGISITTFFLIGITIALGVACIFYLPSLNYAEIGKDGIVYHRALIKRRLAWSEIESVDVKQLSFMGIKLAKRVVLDLKGKRKFPYAQAVRGLGVDGVLPGTYKQSPDEMAEQINQYRRINNV